MMCCRALHGELNHKNDRGLWIWSKPFIIERHGDKVAVFLVDSEGSLNIKENKESMVKMSTISMILSNYLIYNTQNKMNTADLEYLEMFLHIANTVEEIFHDQTIQHMDILVRDYKPAECTSKHAKKYLTQLTQDTESSSKFPKCLNILKHNSGCYLMPNPGMDIPYSKTGTLQEMGLEFKKSMEVYVKRVVDSAAVSVKSGLTCASLAEKIKVFANVIKNTEYGLGSPLEMKEAMEKEKKKMREEEMERMKKMEINLHNQRVMDSARRDHAVFLKEKDALSQRMIHCLKVTPSAMAKQLVKQRRSLLGQWQREMKGQEKETLHTALQEELTREDETFLETYRRRYENHTINQTVMERARQEHTEFLKEKDALSQRMIHCLMVTPSAMAEQLAGQRRSLLGWCRKEMKGQKKETRLTALEEELNQKGETFLETYKRRYDSHTINQRVMERARRDHADFLREKDALSQRMIDCLKVTPGAMEEQLVEQRRSLLCQCRKDMMELEKETRLTALEEELTQEDETFLETYGRRYESHTINQRVMEGARQEHADFLKEKDGLSQRMIDCLMVTPSAMAEQLAGQRTTLLERCQKEMMELEKETLLMALEKELAQEAKTFLETYRWLYQSHTTNQAVMGRARQEHADFLKQKDGLSQRMIDCLTVTLSEMKEQLVGQRMTLLWRCRKEMKEQEKETLLTMLEEELTREDETFLETYGRCYESHTINQRVMERARQDHTDILKQKDALSQCMIHCLTVTLSEMKEQLVGQRMTLLWRCQKEMKEQEKETLLTMLEEELTREDETFLETYRRRHESHTINQAVMGRARQDHTDILKQKDGPSQHMNDCLMVTPSAMAEQLAGQRRSLLEQCEKEMKGQEKETRLTALEEELTQKAETFLETYTRRYEIHTINQRVMERARRDHADFLREKDGPSQHMNDCLMVTPSAMAEQLAGQRRSLLEQCEKEMKGQEKETLLRLLEEELTRKAETFLETYRRHYQTQAINQSFMERAQQEHADFLKEKDALSQRMIDCLMVTPSAMAEQLVEQRRLLLGRCQKEMKEQEKETRLRALEEELTRDAETFLETYRRRYESHTINQAVMGRARQEHADFLKEKDGLSQRMNDCLKVTPSAMEEQLVEQRRSLLEQCEKEMKGQEKETRLTALKEELTREAETFLETYGRRYQIHITNQTVMKGARQKHANFLREKDALSQHMNDCLKVTASAMAEQLVGQRRSLLGQCQKEMKGQEKETLLTALEEELTQEAETFLETYRSCFEIHTINQTVMERARRDHADFLAEKDDLSQHMNDCLKVDPDAMAEQLVKQCTLLREQCKKEMKGQEKETRLTALEEELTQEAETFLETYRRRYENHTINQTVMEGARRDHADFLREKDGLSQHMNDCLKVTPSAMAEQLAGQRRSLLWQCQKEMKGQEKETLLRALEEELTQEAETFLETYGRRYQIHTINQRVLERARRDHADFLREKDGLSQRMIDCLMVTPSAMAEQLAGQRRSLLWQCQKEMKELEKETLLAALQEELTREDETFLETYTRRHEIHTINQTVMEGARQDHTDFLREKDDLSQRMIDCLMVTPSAMAEQLVGQRRSLLGRCQKEMKGQEKETRLAALKEELTHKAKTFLETYGRRYQIHTINQRVTKRARRDHTDFLRKKGAESRGWIFWLLVSSSEMAEQLAGQRRSLLERCRREMKGQEKETILRALEEELTREAETLLETYRRGRWFPFS
ncbi:ninein [Chelonia mydas]|uniref:ninein n=1 Tax=Chelonia mydas TaxID=8469 RepID=UPI001CA82E62|nr:ninein [Chelonia mydas]